MNTLEFVFALIFSVAWVLHSGLLVVMWLESRMGLLKFQSREHEYAEWAARVFVIYSWLLATGILIEMWR